MPKYVKKETVVEAISIGATGNYGVLGSLNMGDFILTLEDDSQHTMTAANVALKYDQAADNKQLTGDDWD